MEDESNAPSAIAEAIEVAANATLIDDCFSFGDEKLRAMLEDLAKLGDLVR